jgi:hypothetical protein
MSEPTERTGVAQRVMTMKADQARELHFKDPDRGRRAFELYGMREMHDTLSAEARAILAEWEYAKPAAHPGDALRDAFQRLGLDIDQEAEG